MNVDATKIGPESFVLHGSDDYARQNQKSADPEIIGLISKLDLEGKYCVDIGANIGVVSLLLAALGEKKVLSFEPNPKVFDFLKKNLLTSKYAGVFEPKNLALGSKDAELRLQYPEANSSGGFISESSAFHADLSKIKVTVKTGDREINMPKVDFIKIDVEGYELQVLEGLRGQINKFNPVVLLEMNHWCLNAFQRVSIPDFIDTLYLYFNYVYVENNNRLLDLSDPTTRYEVMYEHILHFKFSNVICANYKLKINFLGKIEY